VNSYAGATNVAAGSLRLPTGLIGSGGGVSVAPGTRLEAGGTISRAVVNNGALAGPTSPATLSLAGPVSGAGQFQGNLLILNSFSPGNNGPAAIQMSSATFGSSATLLMDLGGETAGSQYDVVTSLVSASLGGTLQVTLANGFVPAAGDRFTLVNGVNISGSFATTVLPTVPNLSFAVAYSPTSVVLAVTPALTGDYNADGRVNGSDFVLWQRTLGSTTQLAADGNGNGVIDAGDFGVWQGNVGAAANGGTTVVVTEPTSFALLTSVGLVVGSSMRRNKKASQTGVACEA
jgi:hypothetical protein